MKILYFSYVDLDTPNACRTHTLGLIDGFAANGCRVDAVTPRPSTPVPRRELLTFHFLNPYGRRRDFLWEVPYSAYLLWSLCRRGKYDVIYARDMDVFIGPRLCSQIFGLPLFLEIDDTPVEGDYPPLIRRVVEANLRLDYRQAAGFIVPAAPRCRIIHQRFGVPEEKIHMILNGTDELPPEDLLPKAEAKRRLGLPEDSFCLGYLGSVFERYDFATPLAAMAACLEAIPRLYFIIVGSGSSLEEVKGRAAALGLRERVLFTGFLHRQEFIKVLPAMDVGLMLLNAAAALEHGPIHTKMPTYACFNLPAVAGGYTLEGYPEEVRRGVWLVPPENVPALAALILRLYLEPKAGEEKARSLRRYVLERLTWKAVAADIMAVMEKSCKRTTAG
jgi:glycosyltransferase involved in cell wall biosynthesis